MSNKIAKKIKKKIHHIELLEKKLKKNIGHGLEKKHALEILNFFSLTNKFKMYLIGKVVSKKTLQKLLKKAFNTNISLVDDSIIDSLKTFKIKLNLFENFGSYNIHIIYKTSLINNNIHIVDIEM